MLRAGHRIQHRARIRVFEGGAQGEHKLSRGMLPVRTWSAHWIEDPVFGPAIANFLQREGLLIDEYLEELLTHSPFRQHSAEESSCKH